MAIEANICSDHLSDTLLLALSQLASSGDTHPACERLCVACFLTAQFAPWGSFQPGEHRRNLPKPAVCLLLDAVHGALEMAAVEPVSDVQVKFQYLPKGVLSEADMRAWAECYGEVTEVRIQCQGQTFKNGHRHNYHYEEGFVRMTREKAAKSFANDLANTRLRNAKGGFDAQEVGGLAFTSSPFPVQLQGRELQRRPHLHRSALARPMKTVVMVRAGMSVGCAVGREKESTSH